MKIVTNDQAVLDLILGYWNNPTPIKLENTLKLIREYYPVTHYSSVDDWEFKLTPESLVNISKKYLKQDLWVGNDEYRFVVHATNLSFKILSREEYMSYIIEAMNKTCIPIFTG